MDSNTQRQLDFFRQKSAEYRPNDAILNEVRKKIFVAAVGPPGVGKSTTFDKVALLDGDFGRTGSVMTRNPEPRDDPQFCRYISKEQALRLIERREFVNYIVHPTTHNVYGTEVDMYSHTYNMLETLPGAVNYFQSLGFKTMHALYIVTEPDAWQAWFNERYKEKNQERAKRLEEARLSLEWSLAQTDATLTYILNEPGKINMAAKKVIDRIKYDKRTKSEEYKEYARAMLQRTEEMK